VISPCQRRAARRLVAEGRAAPRRSARPPGAARLPSLATCAALAIASLAACKPSRPGAALEPPARAAAYTPVVGFPGATSVELSLGPGAGASFFSRPWPSELARTADGRLELSQFPRGDNFILAPYLAQARRDLDGFSLSPTVYFHLTGPIQRARLPASLEATLAPTSTVFLMDVDPQSPDLGARYPLAFKFYDVEGSTVPANTLAMRVASGFVLRPGTLHAAVVRRSLGDAAGAPLGTPQALEHMKWTSPLADAPGGPEERARLLHAAALDALAARGVGREEIAGIALFRTQQPHAITDRMVRAAASPAPADAPRLIAASWDDAFADARPPAPYWTITGQYCTPSYQGEIDEAPFVKRGGGVRLGARGAPEVIPIPEGSRHHAAECGPLMRARFVLTIPRGAPPPEGFPLMISAHGTGGDASTFLGQADFAGWAAGQGVAVVSTDQPLHGRRGDPAARPGSQEVVSLDVLGVPLPFVNGINPSLLFYNPLNPVAARDNLRQATADAASLITLFAGLDLGASRSPSGTPLLQPLPDRAAPRLRRDRVMAAGHSQGSQSLAVLGALDARVEGVILSGCGGDTRHGILHNKEFAEFKGLLTALLGLSPGELDEFHPILALVQTLSDAIDPQSYARFYRDPLPGRRPQSVLHFEGVGDRYNPQEAAEALAIALRAQPLGRLDRAVEGLSLLGLRPSDAPLRGNASGGKATIAFSQLTPTHGEDGHFVIYHEPDGGRLIRQFIHAVAAGEHPVSVGPASPASRAAPGPAPRPAGPSAGARIPPARRVSAAR
jgi:hypothetical protein